MAHMFSVDYESVVELFAMISHMSGKQSTGLDLHVFFFLLVISIHMLLY